MIKFNHLMDDLVQNISRARKIIIVEISFCARNAIKNETKNVNQNSFFSLIFAIFWMFWPIELRK